MYNEVPEHKKDRKSTYVCDTKERRSLNALSFCGVSMNVRQQQVQNM